MLTVIRRHLFNHFQRRVVAVRFQNDDLIRKPERLPDDICRIVVMVQNGLNQDQIERLVFKWKRMAVADPKLDLSLTLLRNR